MSGVITKIHLSPTAAGKLFQKACALEKEVERLQSRVAEKCDAPVGWIAPDKYRAACESKMKFFKTIKELREQNEKLHARVAELESDEQEMAGDNNVCFAQDQRRIVCVRISDDRLALFALYLTHLKHCCLLPSLARQTQVQPPAPATFHFARAIL